MILPLQSLYRSISLSFKSTKHKIKFRTLRNGSPFQPTLVCKNIEVVEKNTLEQFCELHSVYIHFADKTYYIEKNKQIKLTINKTKQLRALCDFLLYVKNYPLVSSIFLQNQIELFMITSPR